MSFGGFITPVIYLNILPENVLLMPCFLFTFPHLFCSHLYFLSALSSRVFTFPIFYCYCSRFPFFHQVAVKPICSKLLSAFFFLLLLLNFFRFSSVFMKRCNKALCLYQLLFSLLTWTRKVCRMCYMILKKYRLKNS